MKCNEQKAKGLLLFTVISRKLILSGRLALVVNRRSLSPLQTFVLSLLLLLSSIFKKVNS